MNRILPLNNLPVNYSPALSNLKLNPNKPYNISMKSVDSIQKIGQAADPEIIPAKMLLSLLKCGLNDDAKIDEKLFQGRTKEDWIRLNNLAVDNAVAPTVFNGLEKNPNIKAPEEVAANLKESKEYAKKYHGLQEKLLGEFSDFTKSKGIDTVQMKGIGFSMNYPDPTARFGGDIDIYNFKHGTNPADPKNSVSLLVDQLAEKNGIEVTGKEYYKHSHIDYKGMPIENHRKFLDVKISPLHQKMNDYLFKHLKPVEETLPHGTKILVPSKEFNNVFIPFHAMAHFVNKGINFHHLADWAVQVKKHGLNIPEEVKGTKLEDFMYAFTNLANKHLGTNIKVPENKKLENEIFDKMLHPEKYEIDNIPKPKHKNPVSLVVYKYKKIAENTARQNKYWGNNITVTQACFKSFVEHLKHPTTFVRLFTRFK